MQAKVRQVYFRRKNKTTYAIAIKPTTTLRAVELLLSKREAIPPESIMFFYRGQPISFTLQGLPSAGPECIVHVVDLDGVKRETVNFSIIGFDGVLCNYSASAATKVKEFVQQNLTRVDRLPYFYIGLVYLGKLMSPDRTLFEEFVEEGCEVVAVNLLELKGRLTGEKVIDGKIEVKGGVGAAELKEDGRLSLKNGHLGGQIGNKQQSHPPHQQQINPAADGTSVMQNKAEDIITIEKVAQPKSPYYQQELPDMDQIPFNIQVSKVESVQSEDGQHNNVKFQNYQDPFDQSSSPEPSVPGLMKESLGGSNLTGEEFIVAGGGHESQTKSFIDRLMKKYKIMFE